MIICRLSEIAKQKKMSLYKLRQITGVTYPTLLKLSHNKAQMFDAKVLDKLCRTLRCGPGDLLVWKPERYPRLPKNPLSGYKSRCSVKAPKAGMLRA